MDIIGSNHPLEKLSYQGVGEFLFCSSHLHQFSKLGVYG